MRFKYIFIIIILFSLISIVSAAIPVSNFTGTPISGNIPLSVQFNDTTGANLLVYSQTFNGVENKNLLLYPDVANGAESGTAGYLGGGSTTDTSSTDQAWQGTHSIKAVGTGSNFFGVPGTPLTSLPNSVYTFSFYAKSNVSNNLDIYISEVGHGFPTNTVLPVTTSEWTRYIINATTNATTPGKLGLRVYNQAANSATYYDGIQLEAGASVTEWIEPPTQPWTVYKGTLYANNTTAPDGTTTAGKIVGDAIEGPPGGNDHYISQEITLLDNTDYIISAYMKKGEWNWGALCVHGKENTWRSYFFDLNNGTVGSLRLGGGSTDTSLVANITNAGNGWYRCSVKFNSLTGAINPTQIMFFSSYQDVTPEYTGNNIDGVYIWATQVERGTSATPYKITTSTTIPDVSAWLWDFGDGSTSTSQNPLHTYTAPGTFTVSLRSTNDNGYDDESKTGYITTNTGITTKINNKTNDMQSFMIMGVFLIIVASLAAMIGKLFEK